MIKIFSHKTYNFFLKKKEKSEPDFATYKKATTG